MTLPAIYAAENSECSSAIERFFRLSESERNAALEDLLDKIRCHGGVERAEATASEYIDKALQKLEVAPPSESRDSLASIALRVKTM